VNFPILSIGKTIRSSARSRLGIRFLHHELPAFAVASENDCTFTSFISHLRLCLRILAHSLSSSHSFRLGIGNLLPII
jgi:hypothetical protein